MYIYVDESGSLPNPYDPIITIAAVRTNNPHPLQWLTRRAMRSIRWRSPKYPGTSLTKQKDGKNRRDYFRSLWTLSFKWTTAKVDQPTSGITSIITYNNTEKAICQKNSTDDCIRLLAEAVTA